MSDRKSTLEWPRQIFEGLRRRDVRQVAYVPDGGHADLIRAAARRRVVLVEGEDAVADSERVEQIDQVRVALQALGALEVQADRELALGPGPENVVDTRRQPKGVRPVGDGRPRARDTMGCFGEPAVVAGDRQRDEAVTREAEAVQDLEGVSHGGREGNTMSQTSRSVSLGGVFNMAARRPFAG